MIYDWQQSVLIGFRNKKCVQLNDIRIMTSLWISYKPSVIKKQSTWTAWNCTVKLWWIDSDFCITISHMHTHMYANSWDKKRAPTRAHMPCLSHWSKISNGKSLTAKDGCSQVLDTGDGGGQACNDAHDPIKKGGVGGHSQYGGLTAADLLSLHHNSEAHAEVVRPPQGSHHIPTHEPAQEHDALDDWNQEMMENLVTLNNQRVAQKEKLFFHTRISHVKNVFSYSSARCEPKQRQ